MEKKKQREVEDGNPVPANARNPFKADQTDALMPPKGQKRNGTKNQPNPARKVNTPKPQKAKYQKCQT
jgi:hypothetical protein